MVAVGEGVSSAETGEGRTSPKGNGGETAAARTLRRDTASNGSSPCAERRDRARVVGTPDLLLMWAYGT
jgi:hypothetical protein